MPPTGRACQIIAATGGPRTASSAAPASRGNAPVTAAHSSRLGGRPWLCAELVALRVSHHCVMVLPPYEGSPGLLQPGHLGRYSAGRFGERLIRSGILIHVPPQGSRPERGQRTGTGSVKRDGLDHTRHARTAAAPAPLPHAVSRHGTAPASPGAMALYPRRPAHPPLPAPPAASHANARQEPIGLCGGLPPLRVGLPPLRVRPHPAAGLEM